MFDCTVQITSILYFWSSFGSLSTIPHGTHRTIPNDTHRKIPHGTHRTNHLSQTMHIQKNLNVITRCKHSLGQNLLINKILKTLVSVKESSLPTSLMKVYVHQVQHQCDRCTTNKECLKELAWKKQPVTKALASTFSIRRGYQGVAPLSESPVTLMRLLEFYATLELMSERNGENVA